MAKKEKKIAARQAVVIEIGNDWLKIIQSEPAKNGISVSKIHLHKFDTLSASLSKSIQAAYKKCKFSGIPVIGCLPRQMVNIKILELPSTDAEEIEDMVDLQIGKQTPYSRDEIHSDYRILGAGREGYTRIMLIIVQRSVLRERFYIFEDAGIEVGRMSVSTEGLINWAAAALTDGSTSLVLDVDSFYTDFLVMGVDGLMYTRSILVGARHLQENPGIWLEKLATEVERSIQSAKSEQPELQIQKIILTGAGSNIDRLAGFLKERTGLAVLERNISSDVKSLPKTPDLSNPEYQQVSLTALAGMAMAPDTLEFKLEPDNITLRRGLLDKARSLTTLGIMLMSLLVVGSLFVNVKMFLLKYRYNKLDKEYTMIQPIVMQVLKHKTIVKVARKRVRPEFSAANIMAELNPLVPADKSILIERLVLSTELGTMEIKGTAVDRGAALKFEGAMNDSKLFKDVDDSGIDKDPRTGQYKFTITCSLEMD